MCLRAAVITAPESRGLLNLALVHERCVRHQTRRGSAGAAAPLAITPLQQFTLLEHSHTPMTKQLQTQG